MPVETKVPSEKKKVQYIPVPLADSPVFVAVDEGGHFLKMYRRDMVLQEGIHYNKINGKYRPNAPGYDELNRIANLSIFELDPKIERNPDTHCLEVVTVPVFGIGFAPTGNMVIIRETMIFEPLTYLIQDLQARIKKTPACGIWGPKNQRPDSWKIGNTDHKVSSDKLYFQAVIPSGDSPMGLWVDRSHPEIIAAFNEFTQKLKFAVRLAGTIGRRRVLAAHPCIGRADITDLVKPGAIEGHSTAVVPVYGYRSDLGQGAIQSIAKAVEEGNYDQAENIAGTSIEVKQSEPEHIDYEDASTAAEETQAEEQAAEGKTTPTTEELSQVPPAESWIVKLQEAEKMVGRSRVLEVVKSFKNYSFPLTETQAEAVWRKLQASA